MCLAELNTLGQLLLAEVGNEVTNVWLLGERCFEFLFEKIVQGFQKLPGLTI